MALWCSAVCALAVLLTTLNLLPPVEVQYKVRSQIIVAQPRLEKLQNLLASDRKLLATGQLKYAQLTNLKVLGDSGNKDNLLLMEIDSLWTGRTSKEHVQAWLGVVTKADTRSVQDTEAAKLGRFARWQMEATQHYQQHHQHVLEHQAAAETSATLAASSSSTPTVSFASSTYSKPPVHTVANTTSTDLVESKLQLTESFQEAEVAVEQSIGKLQEEVERYSGPLELTGKTTIKSISTRMPRWMVGSLMILALATTAISSWLFMRQNAGNDFDPSHVAQQLAASGLPVLEEIQLSNSPNTPSPKATRKLFGLSGEWLLLIGERVLTVWCCIIFLRILCDPLWRGILFESPLAAFTRLLSGMP